MRGLLLRKNVKHTFLQWHGQDGWNQANIMSSGITLLTQHGHREIANHIRLAERGAKNEVGQEQENCPTSVKVIKRCHISA